MSNGRDEPQSTVPDGKAGENQGGRRTSCSRLSCEDRRTVPRGRQPVPHSSHTCRARGANAPPSQRRDQRCSARSAAAAARSRPPATPFRAAPGARITSVDALTVSSVAEQTANPSGAPKARDSLATLTCAAPRRPLTAKSARQSPYLAAVHGYGWRRSLGPDANRGRPEVVDRAGSVSIVVGRPG
jgi:hypothetical protein